MAVDFNYIPPNLREPGFYAEVNNSLANTGQQTQRTLVIGQVLGASTLAPNVPTISAGGGEAIRLCGGGSMLAQMVAAYGSIDSFGEIWYGPLADAEGSAAAAGSITFTGPATAAGVLSLYLAACPSTPNLPDVIEVAVTSGMTAAQIATAVVAEIAATPNLPVSAAVDGAVPAKVDLTALNKGLCGNDIDIRFNYQGTAGGEAFPAGVTAAVIAMSGGAINPTLATLLSNLASKPFDFIVSPYTDVQSVTALTQLLNDVSGRWSWQSMVFGHAFVAYRSNYSGLGTFGQGLNDQHTSVMGFYDSPSPNWVWSAAYAAAAAVSIRADPAVPLTDDALPCVYAPPMPSQFELPMRNALAFDGISTFVVNDANEVQISNVITTYQRNAEAAADDSYLQVNTLFSLMAYLRQRASFLTSNYGKKKLVADGTVLPTGSNCVTPSTIRGGLISNYVSMSPELVQDVTDYAAGLVVQINTINVSRIDIKDDPILTGGVRIFALLAEFQNAAPVTASAS